MHTYKNHTDTHMQSNMDEGSECACSHRSDVNATNSDSDAIHDRMTAIHRIYLHMIAPDSFTRTSLRCTLHNNIVC